MKKTMRSFFTAATTIAALILTGSALAANPVAVWNNFNEPLVNGDYTIDLNGNTLNDDGSVTIGDKPILVNWSSGVAKTVFTGKRAMVAVKYSNLTIPTSGNTALVTVNSTATDNGHEDITGVLLLPTGKQRGIWLNALWSNTSESTYAMSEDESDHTFIFFGCNGGSHFFFDQQYSYGTSSLGSSKGDIIGIAIGGTRGGGVSAATGMIVKSISVWSDRLSGTVNSTENKSFQFPVYKYAGSNLPDATTQNLLKSTNPYYWGGTIYFENSTANNLEFYNYGNLYSKIVLRGATGFPRNNNNIFNGELVLEDPDPNTPAWTFNDGYSNNYPGFGKLSGSGTFKSTSTGVTMGLRFHDVTQFTGTFYTNAKRIMIGNNTSWPTQSGGIRIGTSQTATIASGKTWTAAGGFEIDSGSELIISSAATASGAMSVSGSLGGAGTVTGATTFNEGAKIKPAVGGLKFGNTITGSVTIDCADIVAAEGNGSALITMTGENKTLPSYTLENATGYVAAEKEGVLYLVKKEVRDFYSKWDAAPGILTYKSGTLSGGSKLIVFDSVFGVDTEVELTDTTASTLIPGCGGASIVPWKVFIQKSGYNYVAPGHVLRFSGDYTGVAMGGNFAPFNAGGLLVEKGATGYSMTASTGAVRDCYLGDMNGVTPMWTVINESFTFARGGRAQDTFSFVGPVHVEVAEDKIFTISNGAKLDATRSASLIMHGAGKIKFNNGLNATGAVTLDYSNLELGRESAFIEGNLTVDKDTTFKFPAGFNPTSEAAPSSFRLCSGTLTGAVNGKRAVAFDDTVKLVDITFSEDGTVTYVDVNEKSWTGAGADANWSTSANWDPADKPTANADVKIAAEDDDVAINLNENTASLASLTFSGSHDITFSGTGAITAETIDFTYLTGKVVVGADGLALNGTISGTMTVDPSAVPVDTVFLKGTAIAAANVSFVNVPAGIGVVKTDAGYKTVNAISLLRYGYAFEDNVNKEEAATSSISIGDVSTYEAGVKTRALAFRNGKNYGNDFGFGGGDFTIFAVVKAPTDANKCIFSVGGQKGTAGMLGLRTAGANSVAVFTKDGTDLITVSVEGSATMYHYYALKYDSTANTIALSVDGGEFGTPVEYTSSTAGQFQFGGIHSGKIDGKAENATNGAIDEFQLYTARLTTEQIQTLGAAFEPNTWQGTNGGAWATASNWSYGEVPAAGASVIIPTGDAAEVYAIDFAGAEVSLGSVKVTGAATNFEFANGEVSMAALNSAVDIQVGADDTLVFSNRTASITLAANKAIKGSGRVVMVGHGITGTSDLLDTAAFPGCKDADNWTGTLEVRDWHGEDDANHSKFGDDLGNTNSVICLNGFKGYVYAKDFAQVKAYEIGEDGVEFVGQFSKGNIGFVGNLIGSGDLKLSLTGNDAKNGYLRFVGDSSAYTGSFSFAGNNAFPISLIPSTDTQMPLAEFSQRMIILAVEAGAWTVNGDVEVIAGASFNDAKKPTVNGKIKFDSAVTVTLAEAIPAEGALIINDTTLKPGMVYTAPIAGTAGGVEIEAGYHPVATEAGVVVKLAEVAEWNDQTILIKGVKTIDSATVVGACTVKGEGAGAKATISSISVAENASLTLDGVTVEVEDLNVFPQAVKLVNGARLVLNDTMTMLQLAANETLEMEAGTQYSIYNVPNFASGAMLKIKNAANLAAGNYLLIDWKNWPNPDLLKYGQLTLQLEGFEGDANHIRLVYEPYKIWLQVMSEKQIARKPITIECIGDSITEGLNNAGGNGKNYRIPLFNKLSLAGYNVKTVGYWSHSGVGDGSIDPSGQNVKDWNPDWLWHSGKGSARAGALNGQAAVKDGWSNMIDIGGAPDVVLLHIGINDMLNNNGGENDPNGVATYEYITNMVTEILRTRPDVKLVMSAPMCNAFGHSEQTATYQDEPNKKDTNHKFCEPCHEMCLNFFNQVKAGEWLAEIPGAADRLFYAKNYENIMPSWYDTSKLYLNDGSDHCHPNWLGHDIMAEDWFEQITNAFPLVDGPFNIGRAEKGTYDETNLGAENNVPEEYLNGFVKARQLNNAAFKTMHFTVGADVPYDYTNENIKADTEITKVGYFVEYVRATETTNLHRYVWVDMDAFGKQEVKTLAEVGIPTKGNQQAVVSSLHVYGNHPGVYNIDAGDNTVTGFVEFSPYNYGATGSGVAGAPAHRYSYDWNDTLSETDVFGTMQVHRKFVTPELKREGQVVFAYNGWTRTDATYTTFGIGNFGQSFTTSSLDWTNLETIDTCNTSGYTLMNIEIWVKPAVEPVAKIGDKTYETIEAALAAAQSGETVTVLQDAQLASLAVPADVTLDLNGKAVQAAAIDNKGTIVIYDAATAVAFVGNDIAGTIKFGADIMVTCGDIGGFPSEYDELPVYQFPQNGKLNIIPPTDMGQTTLNLWLSAGDMAADMIGLEAKKALNVIWTGNSQYNMFVLAGEVCRGSRVDTAINVGGNGLTVIGGPVVIGCDSTNPNIDYTTYPDGKAVVTLMGDITTDKLIGTPSFKIIPEHGKLVTYFDISSAIPLLTEEGASVSKTTQYIDELHTQYIYTAEWDKPEATIKDVTVDGFDFAFQYTAANEAPHYNDEVASFVLSANKAIPADAVQIGGKFATMDWNIYNLPAIDANTEYTITEATWAQVKAISPFTCGAASIALTEDTEITLTLKLGEAVIDTQKVTLKAKAIEPVDPEESKSYDTEKEAQDAADKMNGEDGTVKPEFINAPEGITSDAAKAEYAKLFKAVADGKTVMVQLTEAAQIAIKTELANAENEQTILEPDEDGKATIAAKPGLYYGIVAEDSLDKMATAEGKNWVMATDTTVKVTVPEVKDAEGTRAKAAFFRPTCSVKNPRK